MDLSQDGLLDVLGEIATTYPQYRTQIIAKAQALDAGAFCQFLIEQNLIRPEDAPVLFQKIESLPKNSVSSTVVAPTADQYQARKHAGLEINPDQLNRFLTGSGSMEVVGQLFAGKYLILREIGRGGMGLVVEAKNVQTHTRVALKLCLADGHSVEESQRFQREAQILAQLHHPNIIQVNEYGHDNGVPYYTMELLKGWNFRREVQAAFDETGAGLDLEKVVERVAPIAEALAYCHERGVIHRDVKPENIFIEAKTGRSVLIDFGIVKRDPMRLGATLEGLSLSLTEEGTVLGTPAFMSPEQLDGKNFGELSGASDVWGLCATMFYGLTGVAPVPGDSLINIFHSVLAGEIREIRDFVPNIPAWFERLYQRAMTRVPEQRCSMVEFHETLNPTPSKASYHIPIFVSAVLMIFLVGVLIIKSTDQPLLVDIGPLPNRTSKETVTLSGNATALVDFIVVRGGEVLYQSKKPERRFSAPVHLEVGMNKFSISAVRDGNGSPRELSFSLERDIEAPRVTIVPVRNLLVPNDQKVILLDRRCRFKLPVEDSGHVTAFLGDKKLEGTGAKRFLIRRDFDCDSEETLRMVDDVGHETTHTLRILGPGSALKRKRAHEILTDWRKYEGASEEELDYLFARVAELLKPNYVAASPQVFRCGGRQFRIQTFRHETTRVYLRLIPGGLFTMGIEDVDEEFKRALALDSAYRREWVTHATPTKQVRIAPLLVAATELSHGQWLSVFDQEDLNQKAVDFPMFGVSWKIAKGWLEKAGDGFRLPSEAEWEYATRAGTTTRFFWGDSLSPQYLFCRPQKGERPQKVTRRVEFANAFGLVDTLGNLWELCEDSYVDNYSEMTPAGLPQRRNHSLVVRRGGCYTYLASDCQVWTRSLGFDKDKRHSGTGLRVFVTVPGF